MLNRIFLTQLTAFLSIKHFIFSTGPLSSHYILFNKVRVNHRVRFVSTFNGDKEKMNQKFNRVIIKAFLFKTLINLNEI